MQGVRSTCRSNPCTCDPCKELEHELARCRARGADCREIEEKLAQCLGWKQNFYKQEKSDWDSAIRDPRGSPGWRISAGLTNTIGDPCQDALGVCWYGNQSTIDFINHFLKRGLWPKFLEGLEIKCFKNDTPECQRDKVPCPKPAPAPLGGGAGSLTAGGSCGEENGETERTVTVFMDSETDAGTRTQAVLIEDPWKAALRSAMRWGRTVAAGMREGLSWIARVAEEYRTRAALEELRTSLARYPAIGYRPEATTQASGMPVVVVPESGNRGWTPTVSATLMTWGMQGIGVYSDRRRYDKLIESLSDKRTFAALSPEKQAAERRLRDLARLQTRQRTHSRVATAWLDTEYPIDRETGASLYDRGQTRSYRSPGTPSPKFNRYAKAVGVGGAAATVAGVGMGAWEVLSAQEGERAFVSLRTAGRTIGTIGGTVGTAAALGSAPGMLLLLGMTPGGGIVLIIIVLIGGWVVGEFGEIVGERVYFMIVEPEDEFYGRFPQWR